MYYKIILRVISHRTEFAYDTTHHVSLFHSMFIHSQVVVGLHIAAVAATTVICHSQIQMEDFFSSNRVNRKVDKSLAVVYTMTMRKLDISFSLGGF